jgi:hypothetical protein
MKNAIYALVLAILLGSLANNALANTIALLPIDTSKVIFDPVLKPLLPIEEEKIVIPPYQPLPYPEIVIPPDLFKGPTISDVALAANANSLLIEWKTNKPATSKIDYGTTVTYTKSLEDKVLVTEHAMAIPASAGQINFRIISEDALGRKTETDNIIIMIPSIPTEENSNEPVDDAADNEAVDSGSIIIEDDADEQKPENNTEVIKPILEINGTEPPADKESALSVTNAILGGFAILLAGVLIGVLVNNSKSKKQE